MIRLTRRDNLSKKKNIVMKLCIRVPWQLEKVGIIKIWLNRTTAPATNCR